MSDLDDKLREILSLVNDQHNGIGMSDEHWIAKIKQAFADEGYISPKIYKQLTHAVEQLDIDIRKEHKCMTGQEWYDRFEDELHGKGLILGSPKELLGIVQEAAKRASNLSGGEDE